MSVRANWRQRGELSVLFPEWASGEIRSAYWKYPLIAREIGIRCVRDTDILW